MLSHAQDQLKLTTGVRRGNHRHTGLSDIDYFLFQKLIDHFRSLTRSEPLTYSS